ncbi:DgyrCDS4590 [Dimorphilus gyrociliatus]|uniref:DgyrCDS4590 n=1 Tax=Dimorphilus gyrociliatus TaxID=2664684 RepID=A0A7I8VJN0_9ANNE|nr:DgyrCDS4590 [Dimorphilus gyrociliatus]
MEDFGLKTPTSSDKENYDPESPNESEVLPKTDYEKPTKKVSFSDKVTEETIEEPELSPAASSIAKKLNEQFTILQISRQETSEALIKLKKILEFEIGGVVNKFKLQLQQVYEENYQEIGKELEVVSENMRIMNKKKEELQSVFSQLNELRADMNIIREETLSSFTRPAEFIELIENTLEEQENRVHSIFQDLKDRREMDEKKFEELEKFVENLIQQMLEEFEKEVNNQQSYIDEPLELAFEKCQNQIDKLIQEEQTGAKLKKGFENMFNINL